MSEDFDAWDCSNFWFYIESTFAACPARELEGEEEYEEPEPDPDPGED